MNPTQSSSGGIHCNECNQCTRLHFITLGHCGTLKLGVHVHLKTFPRPPRKPQPVCTFSYRKCALNIFIDNMWPLYVTKYMQLLLRCRNISFGNFSRKGTQDISHRTDLWFSKPQIFQTLFSENIFRLKEVVLILLSRVLVFSHLWNTSVYSKSGELRMDQSQVQLLS